MKGKIRKAGVIGAGTMGSAIAAHLANGGIETVLLDIVPKDLTESEKKKGVGRDSREFRNRFALEGLDRALKSKPASFYIPENIKLITVGNLEDDLDKLKAVDMIIEAVVEKLEIKRAVFEKLEKVLTPGTIVTSNTSGISAEALCEGRSDDFRKHFAITHFFNPPRYMKLLEIVPGPETSSNIMDRVVMNCQAILGKGIVYAKDTPNFIANRIGVNNMINNIKAMAELGLSVETVDRLTGTIIGNSKSATFRTADLVGLDVLYYSANIIYEGAPDDEKRDLLKETDLLKKMIDKNLLGEKSNQGFYKKSTDSEGNRVILSLDYNTLEYKNQEEIKYKSFESARNASDLSGRLRALYYGEDLAGEFIFRTISESLIYTANRIPEISNDIVNIDNAVKWGFGRRLGPFELWDSIGLAESVDKMKQAGYNIPEWILEMLNKGKDVFYRKEKGALYYYDPVSDEYKAVPVDPDIILLPALKDMEKKVDGNNGASLIDIGDGVACLEFHSKMNAMGDDIINMIIKSVDIVRNDFDGLIIANHGNNFSAGANLPLILFTAQEEEWDELDWMVKTFQDSFMKLKYLEKPVVAAPFGMALGGGCEICLASDRVRFAAETYMGLVEVGVGLIPAGGGSKELLIRNTEHLFEIQKGGVYPKQIELLPFVARAFETIALAKVSTSGPEAVTLGYLRKSDKMTVNRDFLINDAKKTVLSMNLEGYTPPRPLDEIRVAGKDTLAMLKLAIWTLHEQGYATDHDKTVAEKVAYVLCGGDLIGDTRVSEQYLLDLERENFLSLCGNPKTHARIQHMLMTGKPLRN